MKKYSDNTRAESLLPPENYDDPVDTDIDVRDSQLEFDYDHYDDILAESIGYPDYDR